MKKALIMMAALLTALAVCLTAAAENTAAEEVYGAAAALFFETDNVTLDAKADFSLDGEWFKTAELTVQQDRDRTVRQLRLTSPRPDGTVRENGYTVVCNGEDLYLMEVYTPGVYRTGTDTARESILRRSVESEQLVQLGYALAGKADLLAGSECVTKAEDGTIRIRLEGSVPPLVDALVNQLFRFTAKRYFEMDYDRMNAETQMRIAGFQTVTQGILYTARSLSVREIDVAVVPDGNGGIGHVEGVLGLALETAAEGLRDLDITLRADVTEKGTTMLRKFNPDDYGVVRAWDFGEEGLNGGESGSETAPELDRELADSMSADAARIWAETGIGMPFDQTAEIAFADGVYEICFTAGDDGIMRKACYTQDGALIDVCAEPNEWQYKNIEEYDYETPPDAEADREARQVMLDFLRKIRPDGELDYVKDLKAEWIYRTDGAVYAQYQEEPLAQEEGQGVVFVVRLEPEIRIEYFCCYING